jgi:hypothetical protein
VHAAVLGQRADHLHDAGQGGLQQRRVVIVGPGRDQVQRDALVVAGHGPFGALFAPVDRAAPGHLTSARGLGDRSVHGQVVEVQADHLVVAGQRGPQHLLTDPGLGPVVESAADGAVRAARGGDAFVAAAVHQRGDHVVEHDPVGDPAAVASPRVGRVELGTVGLDQGSELDPQGLGQGCW